MTSLAQHEPNCNIAASTYVPARALTEEGYNALLSQNAREVAYERAGLPAGAWRMASKSGHRYGDPQGEKARAYYPLDAITGERLVAFAFLNADAARRYMRQSLPGYREVA